MDVKGVISTVAPWLGTAIGSPLGGLAVSTIAKLFGLSSTSEKSIAQAISGATPEQMLALKKSDQEFAIKMQELGFTSIRELEQISANDRDSARNMQIQVKSMMPDILAIVVTIGFFSLLGFMLTNPVPEVNRDMLNIMLGSLGTAWVGIIAFYFGTTASSVLKNEIIQKLVKQDNG